MTTENTSIMRSKLSFGRQFNLVVMTVRAKNKTYKNKIRIEKKNTYVRKHENANMIITYCVCWVNRIYWNTLSLFFASVSRVLFTFYEWLSLCSRCGNKPKIWSNYYLIKTCSFCFLFFQLLVRYSPLLKVCMYRVQSEIKENHVQ